MTNIEKGYSPIWRQEMNAGDFNLKEIGTEAVTPIRLHMERYVQWCSMATEDVGVQADLEAIQGDEKRIRERFRDELCFGTGGLRGIMGAGTARMNIYVVRRATRGLAAYIKKEKLQHTVAVGYDSRLNSERFAREAAETLAACGVDVWLYPRLEPTPTLSWAVRKMGCGAGIMITASHNPAEYNGYKVYGSDGCQITDEAAIAIWNEIQVLGYFDGGPQDYKKGRGCEGKGNQRVEGVVRELPEEILDEFLEKELSCLTMSLEGLRVVYTPLNGTGLECVRRSLQKAGISELAIVSEQEEPDGNFPTCSSPNPEKKEVMELGLRLCESFRPDVLLATDPDCDRVGTAVPDSSGGYRLLSGNEMGILLFDYLCRRRLKMGTMPEQPVAITTIVSTDMTAAVASHYDVELRKTLTGFKYIGEQIGFLEREGRKECFLFGFEESFGYLSHTYVRDKDAVNACLMICEMAVAYKREGRQILDVLAELKREYGNYDEYMLTYDFKGVDGLDRMKTVMEGLRGEPPGELLGRRVIRVIDYRCPEKTGLPLSDVLEFRLESGRITVRPSGTEPKMKVYLSLKKTGEDEENGEEAYSIFRELSITE